MLSPEMSANGKAQKCIQTQTIKRAFLPFVLGLKRKLSDYTDVSSEALPEVGDDNVFYEDDAHKQEDLRSSHDRSPAHALTGSSADTTKSLTSPNIGENGITSKNGEYQSEGELTLIPPLELLSRLFPTQKRSVMELILKGCHRNTLRAIECILPSHEKAMAALKSSEFPASPYNPGMRPAFVPSQAALAPYPGAVRQAVYPMHGSHRFPYPMVEYMAHQNCGLRPKCNVDDDLPHKMAVKVNEHHSNIIGKVCQECGNKCSPSSNFCSSCGKDLKET